jgi:hypothetical protein
MNTSNSKDRKTLVEVIHAPLGFFVLALLIVESFIASVLIFSDLAAEQKYDGFLVGVSLFILVVLIVAVFAWFKPHNLTYDVYAHLLNDGKIPFGTSENPSSYKEIENQRMTTNTK